MKKINLTPHPIVFMDEGGNIIEEVNPFGVVARASQREEKIGEIDGLPVYKMEFGEVKNLPEPSEGTIYIVSLATAQACPERKDVFIPAHPVRDEQGRIIGCRALAHV